MSAVMEATETLKFPGVQWCELTKIGLDVKRKAFSYAEWESVRPQLTIANKGSQFGLGDWLLAGEARHGEKVAQAIDAHDKTGVRVKTLMEYRRVSEKVPYSIRMESLEWSHHQVVAAAPEEERATWLKVAVENDWKPEELRHAIKENANPAVNVEAEEDKDYLDPHYKNFLLDYIASQYSFLNRCTYEPFKREIEHSIKAARYQHKRTLQTDYDAVKEQVNRHATTEEEIMEEVPLELDEVKRICELIVKQEPRVYEWRKIGAAPQLDNHHGSATLGIFRVDAPHYEPRSGSGQVETEDWD